MFNKICRYFQGPLFFFMAASIFQPELFYCFKSFQQRHILRAIVARLGKAVIEGKNKTQNKRTL